MWVIGRMGMDGMITDRDGPDQLFSDPESECIGTHFKVLPSRK
jgi:hypothetical protein